MSFKTKFARVLASALSGMLVISMSLSAFAAEHIAVGTVTGSVVNIRSGAGTNHTVISSLAKGSLVDVTEIQNGWIKVEYEEGKFGFMSADYVDIESEVIGTITGNAVNVRAGAGTDYEVIGQVYEGQTFTVVSRENIGWTKISYNGMNAFVCSDYITLDKTENNEAIAKGNTIIETAKKYLGYPYVYGASGPNAFDCSGFTSYIFRLHGYNLNRTAAGQYLNGVSVAKSDLQPGDLVMFSRGYISHVGIYIGDGNMIHAQSSRTGVVISSIETGYYNDCYYGARRVL